MTFENAILRHEPLLIQPELLIAFTTKCASFTQQLKELLGEAPQPQIINGVGIIPVSGIIGQNLAPIEKMLGATDVNDLAKTLDEFERNPLVKTILFDIDSPGGTVTGIPEIAEQVASSSKPTVSFTASLAGSAAYWIGSQADVFYATPSANVGSVGVFMPFVDASAAFSQAGLFVEVIRSGKYKGMGIHGTALTDEQRNHLQEQVNQVHELFKASVRNKRRYVRDESMQGQVFYGSSAVEKNLVSALIASRSALLRKLTS